jgi:glycosyltransferase involved in cell wall biosynthesis
MTEIRPLVSVLVPVYNTRASYLVGLCESILAQSYPHFECLIFDDGSSNKALEALTPYRKDSRFIVFRWHKNRGLNCAWFQLLTKAQGLYWCAPGSDDILGSRFLEKRVALLEAHPYAVFAHGPPEVIDHAGQRLCELPDFGQIPRVIEAEQCLNVLLLNDYVNQPGVVARTDLTRLVLIHFASDWRFAPDWFLWFLLVALGQPVLWDPEPLHQYRIHNSSLSLDPGKEAVRRAERRLVPICALATASRYSQMALHVWKRNRTALYRLWLRRAIPLALRGQLRTEWLVHGSQAYYGCPKALPFWLEVAKHAFGIVHATLTETRERPHQNGLGWRHELDSIAIEQTSLSCAPLA